MKKIASALALSAALSVGIAWAAPADVWTTADFAKTAETLKAKASNGSASVTLAQYGNHHTMLAYRTRDGGAEIHAAYADIFVILRGTATLVTEGTVTDGKEESLGEIRGAAITGGTKTVLHAGDSVHIPAGTPHQMLVAPGGEVVYFVTKIKAP